MVDSEDVAIDARELSVSFGYQCSTTSPGRTSGVEDEPTILTGDEMQSSSMKTSSSFSCLSGAALSANATLANTSILNGLIGEEILPTLDSPKSFRRMASSPSLSRLDLASSSSRGSMTSPSGSALTENEFLVSERNLWKPMSDPTRTQSSSFLSGFDVQMAGGAAGEDRVQAVCSEGNRWLFCGIYDGFNGRDAADFLAGTLYENICFYLHMLESHSRQQHSSVKHTSEIDETGNIASLSTAIGLSNTVAEQGNVSDSFDGEMSDGSFCARVIDCLTRTLAQAESDFMYMVEQEMEDRPDLVSVGSCVLVALLYGNDLYVLNLGDSRAILATNDTVNDNVLKAIQLTEIHSLENDSEKQKLFADHPDDLGPIIINGRVKGKLKITRAFGVGYLKSRKMNDALMGILRVRNLLSPPYIYNQPSVISHRVSEKDLFVVLGSDGLFDFFSNDEVVQLVHLFILNNPTGDPAKYLVEQLVQRAADNAGFSPEDLMRIPAGRRRKYHDDVTIIVVILGSKQRTSSASTSL